MTTAKRPFLEETVRVERENARLKFKVKQLEDRIKRLQKYNAKKITDRKKITEKYDLELSRAKNCITMQGFECSVKDCRIGVCPLKEGCQK